MGKMGDFGAYPEQEKTPFFVRGITEKWIEKVKSEPVEAVNKETGEVLNFMTVPQKRLVAHDPARYVKFMKEDGIKAINRAGKDVLLYVALHLPMNKQEIVLHWKTVMEWSDISKIVFYSGVKELLDKEVLAIKSKQGKKYWVNPNYVFNGNRTKI